MSNTLMPLAIEQIMSDHMDRAADYRRASAARSERRRSHRARVRRTLGAFVGRTA